MSCRKQDASITHERRGLVMRVISTATQCPTGLPFPASLLFPSPFLFTALPPALWTARTPRPGFGSRSGSAAGRPPWPSSPPRPWPWCEEPLRTDPLQWYTCLCANQPQPLHRKGLASLGNGGPQLFRQVPPVPTTPGPLAVRALWWVRGTCCLHLPQWEQRHGRHTSRHCSCTLLVDSVLWQK